MIQILFDSTQSVAGASVLTAILLVAQFNAANALLTEGSRTIYAFARDKGLPFSRTLSSVNHRWNVPVPAVLLTAFCQMAFIAIYFGSATAFFTVISIATVGLYVSYLMPIASMLFHGRKTFVHGPYHLGSVFGPIANVIAVCYLGLFSVIFFFPMDMPITGNTFNYTIAAFGITGLLGLGTWVTTARKRYTGPQVVHPLVLNGHANDEETSTEASEKKEQGTI